MHRRIERPVPMIVVIMGVTGSGKTTVGTMLAEALQCEFLDGDALHPAANIERMTRGVALTDAHRAPWLAAIRARLLDAAHRDESLVVACSALRQSYRDYLADGIPITWVYLKGAEELIRSRLEHRIGHFAKAELLESQVAALEEPSDAIVADVAMPATEIVERILSRLE